MCDLVWCVWCSVVWSVGQDVLDVPGEGYVRDGDVMCQVCGMGCMVCIGDVYDV